MDSDVARIQSHSKVLDYQAFIYSMSLRCENPKNMGTKEHYSDSTGYMWEYICRHTYHEQKALNLKNRTRYRGGFGWEERKKKNVAIKIQSQIYRKETSNNKEFWVTCMSVSQTEAFSSQGLHKEEEHCVRLMDIYPLASSTSSEPVKPVCSHKIGSYRTSTFSFLFVQFMCKCTRIFL